MFARSFLIIFFVLLAASCARHSEQNPHFVAHNIQQNRHVQAFTRVTVDGAFNVGLHTGRSHPNVTLKGDASDLANVKTTVINGALHVNLRKHYIPHAAVQVEIDSRYLNSFEYHGNGLVTGYQLRTSLFEAVLDNQGKTILQGRIGLRRLVVSGNGYTEIAGINSPSLQIKLSDDPKVRLAGFANITSLDLNNDGWLSLYWVKSKSLIVRGHGKALIQLAGIVDKLDVELWGAARFKGRYLRAQYAFVKTHGQSVAEISAVKRQHTLANDNSDIRFYNIPVMKADFMGADGAVLDLRDLASPFVQEYDEYNK